MSRTSQPTTQTSKHASHRWRIPTPQLVKRGKELAESGNTTKGIPACGACHGAGGVGESPTVPYLAGQYAHYTAFELQMWQRGFRRNSPTTMTLFSKLLDDQEIAALAAYYQQLGASAPPPAQRSDRHAD